MDILSNIFYFCIALGVLIAIHEAGHFFMARLMGVYVERFSLGFGPVLLSRRGKNGTEYSLSLLPFGGYVKMYGEDKDSIDASREQEAFCCKKVWQRFLIVLAGPFNNIALAWALYFLVFLMGIPDVKPVFDVISGGLAEQNGFRSGDLIVKVGDDEVIDIEESLYSLISRIGEDAVSVTVRGGYGSEQERELNLPLSSWSLEPGNPRILDQIGLEPLSYKISGRIEMVESGSRAEQAGLQKDDEFLSYDDIPYQNWKSFSSYIKEHPEKTLRVTLKRDSRELTLDLIPEGKEKNGVLQGYAGIMPAVDEIPGITFVRKYDFWPAVKGSWYKTWDMSIITLRFIKKFVTGDISPKNISGPVGIAKGAGLTGRMGYVFFLSFMALISVNLGVLNLLPIPVLDGGHLFFYLLEGIFRKPVSAKAMDILMKRGFVLLCLLMIVAVFNDLYFSW